MASFSMLPSRFHGVFPVIRPRTLPTAQAILNRLTVDDAIVAGIWPFEIANSIFVSYSRRRRITEPQIREYLGLLKALPVRVESQSMQENIDLEFLSRHLKLAAYDAAYVHLALRMNLPLATSDGPLRNAAIAEGVALIG
jgi:predicted nucleic acid-binding protein